MESKKGPYQGKEHNPRNRDTVYIYIGKSHFSGYSNIGSRRWKIILGKSPPTPINFRVGITWLPRRKRNPRKNKAEKKQKHKRSTDCQQSAVRELLHLSMGQRYDMTYKGLFSRNCKNAAR